MAAELEAADTVEVWPENVEPLTLFLRVQTQWRYGPAGRPTGLDYSGVMAGLRMFAPPRVWRSAEFMNDLQVMETAALRAMKG